MKDYKERNNFILTATFSTTFMPHSQGKMDLKIAPQKLEFVMVRAISKSYTLDCSSKSLARPRIVTPSNAASFSIKKQFYVNIPTCFLAITIES